MRRVTFFFVPVIVVVLRTRMVTWRLPHLSTEAIEPAKRFVTTIFLVVARVAAVASTIGSTSAATVRRMTMDLRICSFL